MSQKSSMSLIGDSGAVCCICLESTSNASPDQVSKLSLCGHVFHSRCLSIWTTDSTIGDRSPTCPLCRHPLPAPDLAMINGFHRSQDVLIEFQGSMTRERSYDEEQGRCALRLEQSDQSTDTTAAMHFIDQCQSLCCLFLVCALFSFFLYLFLF